MFVVIVCVCCLSLHFVSFDMENQLRNFHSFYGNCASGSQPISMLWTTISAKWNVMSWTATRRNIAHFGGAQWNSDSSANNHYINRLVSMQLCFKVSVISETKCIVACSQSCVLAASLLPVRNVALPFRSKWSILRCQFFAAASHAAECCCDLERIIGDCLDKLYCYVPASVLRHVPRMPWFNVQRVTYLSK